MSTETEGISDETIRGLLNDTGKGKCTYYQNITGDY